ncbi:MAG: hypothetical protein U9Q66_02760 [Patescibacteria group bacterium]|nr:hypothetical protein [Patescibacteria group bacterium]
MLRLNHAQTVLIVTVISQAEILSQLRSNVQRSKLLLSIVNSKAST